MKNTFGFILFIVVMGCSNQNSNFESIPCDSDESNYSVFKPCRQIIFNARLWDSEFNLISESKIWMMATGNPWEHAPDRQRELVIQYEYDEVAIDEIIDASINRELVSNEWRKQETTGIIEDENTIWMHPFRSNQYAFTEVAPFPSVRLPLEVGFSWSSSLNIYAGWGEWSHSTLSNTYTITGYELVQLPYGELEAWKIESSTQAKFGNSTHNFWFHHDLGFVKMVINNYANQTLEIELLDVIE